MENRTRRWRRERSETETRKFNLGGCWIRLTPKVLWGKCACNEKAKHSLGVTVGGWLHGTWKTRTMFYSKSTAQGREQDRGRDVHEQRHAFQVTPASPALQLCSSHGVRLPRAQTRPWSPAMAGDRPLNPYKENEALGVNQANQSPQHNWNLDVSFRGPLAA